MNFKALTITLSILLLPSISHANDYCGSPAANHDSGIFNEIANFAKSAFSGGASRSFATNNNYAPSSPSLSVQSTPALPTNYDQNLIENYDNMLGSLQGELQDEYLNALDAAQKSPIIERENTNVTDIDLKSNTPSPKNPNRSVRKVRKENCDIRLPDGSCYAWYE